MEHQLEPVQFHGDTIYAVDYNGEPMTAMKPIVENMGLDWSGQSVKLRDGKERWGVVIIPIPSAGGDQDTTCIPVYKLAMFLATINYRKVKNSLRGKIIAYQKECDDALWNYWTKGRAINPRQQEPFPLPDFTKPAEAARAWADQFEKTTTLQKQIEHDRPKVEFAEAIEDSAGSVKVGDFAKVLNNMGIKVGQNRLFSWLREKYYLMNNNMPYQNHIDNGYFVVIEKTRPSLNGPVPYFQTRVTGKGQIAIAKKLRPAPVVQKTLQPAARA